METGGILSNDQALERRQEICKAGVQMVYTAGANGEDKRLLSCWVTTREHHIDCTNPATEGSYSSRVHEAC